MTLCFQHSSSVEYSKNETSCALSTQHNNFANDSNIGFRRSFYGGKSTIAIKFHF